MNNWLLAAVAAVGCLASLAVTPLVRTLARRVGLLDRPDLHRKMHAQATPLGGGLAFIVSAAAALSLAVFFPSHAGRILTGNRAELFGMIAGIVIIAGVGLWDDFRGMRARYKLVGQLAAATVIVASGLTIGQIGFWGEVWQLGWFAAPLTVFWLVLCMNALNLIDGSDGLATTLGIVLFGTIAVIAITLRNELTAVVALALVGALFGVLRYNFPPATIFLGDCGSMTIGLLAGALSVHSCMKGAAAFAISAPLAMWTIPVLDVSMAVLRRKLTGRGLSTTDRLHLHHSLLNRGISHRALLAVAATLSIFSGLGAYLTVRFQNQWFALFTVVGVVGFLAGTRLFGHVELLLAGHHLANWGRRLVPARQADLDRGWSSKVRLQGERHWEQLWDHLLEASDVLAFTRLRLDLNLPWMHEGFHATWQRPAENKPLGAVRLEWPLAVGDRYIGMLTVAGEAGDEPAQWLAKVAEFLADFQDRTILVYREAQAPSGSVPAGVALSPTPSTDDHLIRS